MRILRQTVAALAVALTVSSMPSAAQAGQDEEIFVLGALAGAAGAIVLGGIVAGAQAINDRGIDNTVDTTATGSITNDQVAYCQGRYRTYRVSDNTFQPNNGPRRQCVAPTL